ncbi:MAG: hypothetical protein JW891_04285 [Candidatus Lokiarchaeota archaeon]|nr:hypothetical protein [Candidatus Lokiarchaeota archaeon]
MLEANSVFDTWREYSPFFRRNLMTRNQFWKWLEEMSSLLFKTDKVELDVFMDYLEDQDLFFPVYQARRGSEFASSQQIVAFAQKPPEQYLNEVVKYYHPFQFFQFYMYWMCHERDFTENSKYFFYRETNLVRYYVSDEKKKKRYLLKISKAEKRWIKHHNKRRGSPDKRHYKKFPPSPRITERELTFAKERLNVLSKAEKRKQKKNTKERNQENKAKTRQGLTRYDDFYIHLRHTHWLKADILKVWIKLDSLTLYGEYLISPSLIWISPQLVQKSFRDEKKKETILKYEHWRDEKINEKTNFLDKTEQETLKRFYSTLTSSFPRHHRWDYNGLEHWQDLIDIVPVTKLTHFKGNLNLTVNFLKISRFLERISWEFFEYNLIPWPRNKEHVRPYCFLIDEKETIEYRRSVLSEFSLFPWSPFVIYAEGSTETKILEAFFDKREWTPIVVENLKGIDKTTQALTINSSLKDRVYFFVLDYENKSTYDKYKDLEGTHAAIFYPNFVTENFEPEIVLEQFKKWTDSIGGSLTDEDKAFLRTRLIDCKNKSNELIKRERKPGKNCGYESELIDFAKKNFETLLLKTFPKAVATNDGVHFYLKDNFDQDFKKVFTEQYLIPAIENTLESKKDPERKKFAFETKLEPFYKSIEQYRLRNHIQRYDLEI